MSLPDFSKLKRSRLFGRLELPVKPTVPGPLPQLSGAVPSALEAPTPALPPAPSDWVTGSVAWPPGPDGAARPDRTVNLNGVPAWRAAMQGEACTVGDSELAHRIRETPVETLNAPQGLNAASVLLDACRHGLVEAIHAALDQGADARAKTIQNFSAVDLLVVRAMETDAPGETNPPANTWLVDPQERQVLAVERLLEHGATFDPELLPFLAASPLGVRLEQRALRAAIAPRNPGSVSALPARPRARV